MSVVSVLAAAFLINSFEMSAAWYFILAMSVLLDFVITLIMIGTAVELTLKRDRQRKQKARQMGIQGVVDGR